MKSWYDLTEEEQDKLIEEFRDKYDGITGDRLHDINKFLLVLIIPLALFVLMRIVATTDDTIFIAKAILVVLVIIYIFISFKIRKESKEFVKWLKVKKISK